MSYLGERNFLPAVYAMLLVVSACVSKAQPAPKQSQTEAAPLTSTAETKASVATAPQSTKTPEDEGIQIAFVLANGNALPSPESVIEAAKKLGEAELSYTDSESKDILTFTHKFGFFMISLMPIQHPDAAKMTVGLDSPSPEEIAATSAHFVLVLGAGPGKRREREVVLARLTAAVALANKAPAAMLGHGISFHQTASFIEAVYRAGDHLPIPGSVDFTMAMEADGRVSLLTHGMPRYGREDLYVTAKRTNDDLNDAYKFARTIATWMLSDDRAFPDGDTVGRNETEKIKIRRVENPTNPDVQVIRLDL